MGGVTCTIGGVNFVALASGANRYCISCCVEDIKSVKQRFHPPGVTGNFIVRGGRNGGLLVCHLRYINTLGAATTAYNSDHLAWYNTAVTILDEAGATYNTCNLAHMTRENKPQSMGRGNGNVKFDALAVFDWDG